MADILATIAAYKREEIAAAPVVPGSEEIDVPRLCRALIEVETEMTTEGVAQLDGVFDRQADAHRVSIELERGEFDYKRDDTVAVERQDRRVSSQAPGWGTRQARRGTPWRSRTRYPATPTRSSDRLRASRAVVRPPRCSGVAPAARATSRTTRRLQERSCRTCSALLPWADME